MSDKTFTEEDLNAAVAKATADLATELADLKTSLSAKDQEAEVAKAVEAVATAKDAEITALQTQLDTAVLEGEKAKQDLAALTTLIETEKARADREAELAARRDERLAKVASVASFPEEYVAANADRWTAMDDADFEALCADYAAFAARGDGPLPGPSPTTAMQTERELASGGKRDYLSASKEIMGLSVNHTNMRSL